MAQDGHMAQDNLSSDTGPDAPAEAQSDPIATDRPPDDGVKKASGGFVKHVVTLGGGNVVMQALAIACAPVISRLFAPEAFGAVALFASIVGMVSVVSSLRYHQALMLPKEDEDAASILALCFLLVAGITALAALALAVGGSSLLRILSASKLEPYKWLLPVGVFAAGITRPLATWHSRHKRFKMLAGAGIAATSSRVTVAIGAGALGFNLGGHLILIRLLGMVISPVYQAFRLVSGEGRFVLSSASPSRMRRLAARYAKFPLVSTWSALLIGVSQNVPVLMLSAAFGMAIVGFYSRAQMLIMLPMDLIFNSLGQVLFQRLAEKKAAGQDLAHLVAEVTNRLICVATLPVLLLAVIGRELFTVACGGQWVEAGIYAQILSPWVLAASISGTLSVLFNVLERLGVGLAFNILLLAGRVGAIVLGGWVLCSARWSIALFSAAGTLGFAWSCSYLLSASGVSRRRTVVWAIRHVGYALPMLGVGAIVKFWLELPPWQVVCIVVLASFSYWPLALRHDALAKATLRKIWNRLTAAFLR